MTMRKHTKPLFLRAQSGIAWQGGRDKARATVTPCVAACKGNSSKLHNAQNRLAEL